MTVAELLEQLEDLDPDTEVRLATQPSWPFEYAVHQVVAAEDHPDVVYLSEGAQLGYLPGGVAEEAWSA